MPTYEYKCSWCGITKTKIKSIVDRDSEVLCDTCEGAMQRQTFIGNTSLHFNLSPAFRRNITSFDYGAKEPKKK